VMFWNAKTYTASEAMDAGWALQQLAQIRQAAKSMTPAGRPVEQLQTKLKVGFFGWFKEAAETIAMNICLAGLSIANAVISLTQMVVDGIAAVLIKAMELAIKAMGPRFFQILDLGIGGSFDALQGGKVALNFNLDMWLFNLRIKFGFSIQFTILHLITTLFNKAKDMMGSVFRL